ncbi:MAG: tol-pal system-associated acyl-CoA thioesterase [Rickettsiales bacterium]|nr:tol-pal system-associated acyl-CoA thioesterase [Rickettsiales bacterium]
MPFLDQVHHTEYRVYYEDTDAGGIVYHANYLNFAERARTDALREMHINQTEFRESTGCIFVVRHAEIEYKASAILDDLLRVTTEVTHIGNSSMKMLQVVWRDDIELARMHIQIVCVGANRKAVRIPQDITACLRSHMMKE